MFETLTPDTLYQNFLTYLGETELQTNEGSFIHGTVMPLLMELWRCYLSINEMRHAFYVDEDSGEYIDLLASAIGLSRRGGAKASATVTITGTAGRTVPKGAGFATDDGKQYTLEAAVTLTDGTGTGTVIAEATGADYNAAAGAICRTVQGYDQITTFSAGAATGGVDGESDSSLCARIYAKLRSPATSGNCYDYLQWATSVDGVGGAHVVALENGAGTVGVWLCSDTYGPVSQTVIDAAKAYIETKRPVGAAVTVESAIEKTISVTATPVLSGSKTADEIKAEFTESLSAYLAKIAAANFSEISSAVTDTLTDAAYNVVYLKVVQLLMECEGVTDVTSLTINGSSGNVGLLYKETPVLGEVVING